MSSPLVVSSSSVLSGRLEPGPWIFRGEVVLSGVAMMVGPALSRAEKKGTTGAAEKGTTLGAATRRKMGVLGPAGAKPCEAVARAVRAQRKPGPTRGRAFGGTYRPLSAARFCLLVFSR